MLLLHTLTVPDGLLILAILIIHTLKKGKDGKIVMMHMDYINEFPLLD